MRPRTCQPKFGPMISDKELKGMCRRLLEGGAGNDETKCLELIVAELVERKLVNPRMPAEEINADARAFANAFCRE